MLYNVTWQGYWITLVPLTAGYYLALYLLYFRKEFPIVLLKRKAATKTPSASPAVATFLKEANQPSLFPDTDDEFSTPTEGNESLVYACMDEIAAYFESSKGRKIVKEECVFALQTIL